MRQFHGFVASTLGGVLAIGSVGAQACPSPAAIGLGESGAIFGTATTVNWAANAASMLGFAPDLGGPVWVPVPAGGSFFVSAQANPPTPASNMILLFDSAGTLRNQFRLPMSASINGLHNLAVDAAGIVWGLDDTNVAVGLDPSTGVFSTLRLAKLSTVVAPRAFTIVTAGSRSWFVSQDGSGPIDVHDSTGALVTSLPSIQPRCHGMTYDEQSHTLWCHGRSGPARSTSVFQAMNVTTAGQFTLTPTQQDFIGDPALVGSALGVTRCPSPCPKTGPYLVALLDRPTAQGGDYAVAYRGSFDFGDACGMTHRQSGWPIAGGKLVFECFESTMTATVACLIFSYGLQPTTRGLSLPGVSCSMLISYPPATAFGVPMGRGVASTSFPLPPMGNINATMQWYAITTSLVTSPAGGTYVR